MILTVAHSDLELFRSSIGEGFGLHFEGGKLDFLDDVVRQRIVATGCDCFSDYQQRVLPSAREKRAVVECLTVCETYFFRYAEHFRVFTDVVVPERMRMQDHRRQFRILSAGYASGEEAYSLAILIRDQLPNLASWDITIQGIDINQSVVKKALRAHYPSWSLRDTPADLRIKYLRHEGRELILDAAVKSMVTFEERNLVEEDSAFWRPEYFDVVFCRNVSMYFTPAAAESLIARIARSLTPGGFLFLGHAETLRGISQDFHLRHTHETFYYQLRRDQEADSAAVLPGGASGRSLLQAYIPAESHARSLDYLYGNRTAFAGFKPG
ncbi:MAG TPA: protein-glutamate O-methyltransferase CheR [Candidatus Angelobacter sp.]|nr:protein-glutamate O-methyltransferase CheR [Candidatus Angelobacter sp.]